ncbi:hypothetical protein [Saccharolobus sp.]|uniref:hypothetical protein n=1 Tax=Saccharolobus sp. TaxID=2100761 RepID=UPI0031662A37
MQPLFLEYKVISDNVTYYIIYVFISNISLKLVTMYVINPNNNIILSYNVSLEPQQIFSNVSGKQIYYNLSNNEIIAYETNNLIVAYNGIILKKINNNSITYLIAANYPGISNDKFPNLDELAKIYLFNNNIDYIVIGILLSIILGIIIGNEVRQYAKS